jgi:hypothetical protein
MFEFITKYFRKKKPVNNSVQRMKSGRASTSVNSVSNTPKPYRSKEYTSRPVRDDSMDVALLTLASQPDPYSSDNYSYPSYNSDDMEGKGGSFGGGGSSGS